MKTLHTELYTAQVQRLPKTGEQLIAQFDTEHTVVYQAFNPVVADYAVANQRFGGSAYSFNRMTWIKPNFLWMMFRSGWAEKPNQERILAIWLDRKFFDGLVLDAVHSAFVPGLYVSHDIWQQRINTPDVRLQWDPDHDPSGQKIDRRAIQLGLRGDTLRRFSETAIVQITDITAFVSQQRETALSRAWHKLTVPVEQVYTM